MNIDEAKTISLSYSRDRTLRSVNGDDAQRVVANAREYESYLLGDTGVKSVFVVTSALYAKGHTWKPAFSDDRPPERHIVSVHQTRESAVAWRDEFGLTDAVIEDWELDD